MAPTRVPFYLHDLGREELHAVAEVLRGPVLTTGETVAAFERRFADYLGVGHALGVTSCTGALHLSLLALGIGPGDEVIVPAMTFIASATAVIEAGATPVLVDVEPDTGLLNAACVEAALTSRSRAVIPVHLYGQMCDMRALRDLADRRGLFIVEDAAHCVEGERDGVRPGQLGDTACFSFYATKNLTCGEGGAVVSNDAELAQRLRLLRLHGMTKTAADRAREGYTHWDMVLLGWKYNMDNIQAALLLPQLGRLESNWLKRERLAHAYQERLACVAGVSWPACCKGARHARHLFPIWVDPVRRDALIGGLKSAGIDCMVNYRPMHLLTYFRDEFGFRPGDFPAAERIGASTISLPFYPAMPSAHVDLVCDELRGLLRAAA
jgi:UDP-4-amino-4-deoxy-L-arabinose-oxoglutarate aminotransferase